PLSPAMLPVGFAAGALNLYYWFSGPILTDSLAQLTGVHAAWLRWPISAAIAALTLLWVARTRVSELQFAWTTGARKDPVLLESQRGRADPSGGNAGAGVCFGADGQPVGADV